MTNQIRTVDLIAFFQEALETNRKHLEEHRQEYDREKEKFERSIWHRWFKQEFSRSFGSVMAYYDRWAMLGRYGRAVAEIEEDMKKLAYRQKCGMQAMVWDFQGLHEQSFYNWCANKGIPS